MQLKHLSIRDYRILQQVDVDLHPRLSVIVGDNGAGKSSFLEVVRLFGKAKLPPIQAREACRYGHTSWSCQAIWRVESAAYSRSDIDVPPYHAEMRWAKGLEIQLHHKSANAVELAQLFAVAPIDCSMQRIVAEGPTLRRQFVDWALFHVEPSFHAHWATWRRHLSQRNRLLAQQANIDEIRAWNEGLITSAERLTRYRSDFVNQLRERFVAALTTLLGVPTSGSIADYATIDLYRGWAEHCSYADAVVAGESRDQQRKMTIDGPQRADLHIRVGGAPARLLSRGQQKLVFVALTLAGCAAIAASSGKWPIVSLDDFDAELATAARLRLRNALLAYPGQLLVTQHLVKPTFWPSNDHAMFHVEHGIFTYGVE